MNTQSVGQRGEDFACEYLERIGWRVIDRNWRYSGGDFKGELDVVAVEPSGVLVVVEVKTRTSYECGTGFDAVTRKKLGQLRQLTALWLIAHRTGAGYHAIRLDVVSIFMPAGGPATVEHRVGVL